MPLNERTINSARNPRWDDYNHTELVIEVDFDELDDEFVEFYAHPDDIVSWSSELYNRAIAGEFGEIAPYSIPADKTGDAAMSDLRELRNKKLEQDVDPLVTNPLRWDALSAEKQQEWKDYRQALLDLPTTQSGAYQTFSTETQALEWTNLVLPTKPE